MSNYRNSSYSDKIQSIHKQIVHDADKIINFQEQMFVSIKEHLSKEDMNPKDVLKELKLYGESLTQKLLILDNLIDPNVKFNGTKKELEKLKLERKKCSRLIESHATYVDKFIEKVKILEELIQMPMQ